MKTVLEDDSNTTGLSADGGGAPYDITRVERTQLLGKMDFRDTYTRNTQKEELCLEFVENFRSQMIQLYPQRPPLLLSPMNECGKQKFVSTFIRPTEIHNDELYDYASCAKYIANYIRYEELDDSESVPNKIMSPSTVLAWQVGNCVEMSVLLCSLLLGSGYNAYVVMGYATQEVCSNDQSHAQWPERLPAEVDSEDEGEKVNIRETRYIVKKRAALTSTFDAEEAERLRREAAEGPKDTQEEAVESVDENAPKLVHSWVLLLGGKRKIETPIFIEPSTGTALSISDARYLGIESVFNHHNYYVNMNAQAPISSLSFELRDLSKWEHVFLVDSHANEDDPVEMERTRFEESTSVVGEAGDQLLDLPSSWVVALTLNRAQFENRYPGRKKKIEYADAVVELFADYSEPDQKVMEVNLHDDQSIHNQVHTFYRHREDRLRRKSVYPTQDRLQNPRKVREWFNPGRKRDGKVEGLKEIIFEPGVQRTMKFYHQARDDGLAKRVELFWNEKDPPKKIMEHYRGRDDDRLIYRSATYDPPKDTAASKGYAAGATGAAADSSSRMARKMAEKFDRNPKIPSDQDVAKRTFIKPHSSDGEIWVLYHYSPNCITRPSRQYPKNAEKEREVSAPEIETKVTVMPFAEKPKEAHLRDELRFLLQKEKDCITEIKRTNDEAKDILTTRRQEKDDVKFQLSVYDTLRNRPKESEQELEAMRAEERRRAESRKDYLAPYIANEDVGKSCKGDYTNVKLSFTDAQRVRDAAMRDLRDRLIQRGHIMQNRMDREKEELAKRQANYQKNVDSENAKDTEEYGQYCRDATWRMKILDERLTRHIDQSAEKYAQLCHKLSEDPRLAELYKQ